MTSRWTPVRLALALALTLNVLVYAVGRLAGGDFTFTPAGGDEAFVDVVTVAGFTAVPLGVGLVAVALLAPRWPAVVRVAQVVAPVLALVTVPLLTIPADFDGISTVSLALCHLTLAPISWFAVGAIGRAVRGRAAAPA